jgi:hypothetical protein
MREIEYNIDIMKQNYNYKACMQGDSLKIILNVYNNGSQYDLTGAKVILNFAKPDGTPIVKDDITVEGNIICILDEEYTNIHGKAKFEFEINKDGKTTTFPLELVIAEKVFESSVVNNKIVELLNLVKIDDAIDDFMDSIKKKQAELSSQIAENANLLDARIDAFTTLTEGSTTGDAELVDIRVGINGTIYENAGAAVRAIASGEGLGDKSIDIVKLDAKLQSKFEKTTTTTEVDGDSYAISKYMIVGVDSTSKVVDGTSLTYTTNTIYGAWGWIFPNTADKKYKVTSVIENVGDVDDTVSLMLTYKAEISGGVIAANGDILESNIALATGSSVTKVNTVTTGTDADTYAGVALSVKSSTSGAKIKLTQTVNEINTVTNISGLKMIADVANTLSPEYKKELFNEFFNNWNGAEVLAIGDSLTSAKKWQLKTTELLGCNIITHAKGGKGYIDLIDGENGQDGDYDNETDASGILRPLSVDDVTGKKLIIVYAGYNERHMAYGEIGDVYPTKNTLAGKVQYVINSIYSLLEQADNLTCKLLFITPHCVGTYGYVNIDGYGEYPLGTGRTLEGISNIIKKVAEYNNIEVLDLWHNSGIGKFTWDIYCAKTPASATAPYPDNVDLVHLNASVGYPHLGTLIANKIKTM